jgi:ketosteroid isomerase-like protein
MLGALLYSRSLEVSGNPLMVVELTSLAGVIETGSPEGDFSERRMVVWRKEEPRKLLTVSFLMVRPPKRPPSEPMYQKQ